MGLIIGMYVRIKKGTTHSPSLVRVRACVGGLRLKFALIIDWILANFPLVTSVKIKQNVELKVDHII